MEEKSSVDIRVTDEQISKHVEFLLTASKNLAAISGSCATSKTRNGCVHIQSDLVEKCQIYQGKYDLGIQDKIINKNDICPHCFCFWKQGCYQLKTISNCKRKRKYKITVLELLCKICNKKTKIKSSKVKRTQLKNVSRPELSKTIVNSNFKETKNKNTSNETDEEEKGKQINKIKNESKNTMKSQLKSMNKIVQKSQPKKQSHITSRPGQKQQIKITQNISNFKEKDLINKKRSKLQKLLNKTKQNERKSTALENFLNCVQKI